MSKPSSIPNVAKAGGIMMISLFLSRVLGLIRESITNAQFGQTIYTDAYNTSFQIPDLLFFLIAGGALSSAFIPVFSEYLHTEREDEAWHIFSSVVTIMTLLIVGFVVVAWIFAPQLTTIVAGGMDPSAHPLVTTMSRILLPAQIAFFVGGLLFGTLYARQVFSVPGLGPNIYNIGIIFGAVVLSTMFTPGVIGMSWGALIGAFLGNIIVPLFVLRHLGATYRFSLDTKHPGVRKVFKLMLPVVLGLSLPAVYAMIVRYYGTVYPAGTVSALDAGNKLMQVPLGIFGQSLAIGVFPALSQFFAQGKMDMFRDQLGKTLRTVLYLAMPASAFLICLPREIIEVLFQHGAFTAADTARTVPAVQMFAIGVSFWCMQPVLMRAFFSIQNSVTPIILGTITSAVFLALSYGSVSLGLDYPALPLAGSISAIVLAAMLMVAIRKAVGAFDIAGLLKTGALTALASAVSGLAALGTLSSIRGTVLWTSLPLKIATFAGVVLLAAWLYFFMTRLMKLPESDIIARAMNRLRKSPPATPEP